MKAIVVHDWTPFDQLEIEDLPVPEPVGDQVLIRIQAAGISFALSLVVEGKYQRRPPLPFVPGTEVAGIIEACGPEATRFRPGDRVCAVLDWGGLAEYAVAREVNVYAIPDALELVRAIGFTNSYATSAAALTWPHLLDVGAGDTLLVHGAAGGVGLAAVEIGHLLDATVIATAGTPEKLALAAAHGADHTINYREEDFRARVLDLTAGRGVDAVYDPVGGEVFSQSLRCMAPEARIMPVGFAGGSIPQIPANILLVKNLIVCGLNMGLYFGWGKTDLRDAYEDRMRALMQQLFDWFTAGHIDPVVEATFPLEGAFDAMAAVLAREVRGRAAVVFDGEARRLGH
ncbi:MAG: NADPH:quinone oxidoreductase family protein [Gammaproteobacteria bacterium]